MNSSQYYKEKIEYYTNISTSISSLTLFCTNCSDAIIKCNNKVKNIVISKQSIDDGKLSFMQEKINDIPNRLMIIINECEKKIQEYQILYQKAKAYENMMNRRKKMSNNGGTYGNA